MIPYRERKRRKQRWLEIIAWLHEKFPRDSYWPGDDLTVKVYIKAIDGYFGLAYAKKIYISNKVHWPHKIGTLLHEWAHVVARSDKDLSIGGDPEEWIRVTHSDKWALCYGRIYRAYHTRREA